MKARGEHHEGAPAYPGDTLSNNVNARHPSYTAWSGFCKEVGISELFYGQGWKPEWRSYEECSEGFHRSTPLFAEHPGYQAIGPSDVEYIRQALENRRATNPDPPGLGSGEDYEKVRLEWLYYWMDWAVKNCERPIIHNS